MAVAVLPEGAPSVAIGPLGLRRQALCRELMEEPRGEGEVLGAARRELRHLEWGALAPRTPARER